MQANRQFNLSRACAVALAAAISLWTDSAGGAPPTAQSAKQVPPISPDIKATALSAKTPIVLEQINWSAWDDGKTVALSLLLHNVSGADVDKLVIKVIGAEGQQKWRYLGPAKFPIDLKRLEAGKFAVVDALFAMPADGSQQKVIVEIEGVLRGDVARFNTANAVAPSRALPTVETRRGVMTKQSPRNAKFPPVKKPDPRAEPNAETPMMIPLGPPRRLSVPTPRPTKVEGSSAAGAIRVGDNQTTNVGLGGPPDPSAAVESDNPTGIVIMTYNTGMSYSLDGGNSFTDVNLFAPQPGNPARTSFFPSSYGGLCCDQVVIYLPQHNLFVWLLQYWPVANAAGNITQPNAQRIAWARPADLRADFWNAWTWGDLTANAVPGVSSGLGAANNEWLDYPDLAYSDQFLYVSTDRGWPDGVGSIYANRRFVARLSLADMLNPASGTVGYSYAELVGAGVTKSHFVQNAPGRMVVGSLDNTSTMRVFNWRDASGSIPSLTVPISSITQGANYTSVIPDGSDWVAVGFPGNISGATYRRRDGRTEEYLFAFNAGVNTPGRPRSYVRLETLGPSGADGYSRSAEYDIWNPDYAFAMATLGTNGATARPEIGMTVSTGGGTIGYAQQTVGYKDDFVVYIMTGSNGSQMVRYGDYFATRPIPGAARMFGTTLYEINLPAGAPAGATCATAVCASRVRYVEFGRP